MILGRLLFLPPYELLVERLTLLQPLPHVIDQVHPKFDQLFSSVKHLLKLYLVRRQLFEVFIDSYWL